MKNLTTTLCMVLLTLFAVTAKAQINQAAKPSLFSKIPTAVSLSETQLSNFFTTAKGENILAPSPGGLMLSGPVVSRVAKYSNLETVVIKLAAYNNSLFSLSKQTDAANNITYVGKIINPLYADGFELKSNADGSYELVKIDIEKILVTCNQ